MKPSQSRQDQQGLTLIELIISILVITLAVSGILSVMNLTVARSADPMIQHQALAIAEAYLEEILTKQYANSEDRCPADSNKLRSEYCAVDDYQHLVDDRVRDQEGDLIPPLSAYSVNVVISTETVAGIDMKRVDVTVSHPSGVNIELSGYRANHT